MNRAPIFATQHFYWETTRSASSSCCFASPDRVEVFFAQDFRKNRRVLYRKQNFATHPHFLKRRSQSTETDCSSFMSLFSHLASGLAIMVPSYFPLRLYVIAISPLAKLFESLPQSHQHRERSRERVMPVKIPCGSP